MLGAWLDHVLTRLAARLSSGQQCSPDSTALHTTLATRQVSTSVGTVRVFDSANTYPSALGLPCVMLVPDGPNVIEHYDPLFKLLSAQLRVVCFDMPGFGHSLPQANYTHSLNQGAQAVIGVMDSLGIERATLAFSCANGFYALRTAQIAPQRITQLVLSQTPALKDMHAWVQRIIPWPLRVPVLGHTMAWLGRNKMAMGWYKNALPRGADAQPFQTIARQRMTCGGCFCLAGVVQGLLKEPVADLLNIDTPCTVVWGQLDRSHKPTPAQSLLACVPHAQVVIFDDCGHFPDVEHAVRFAALLLPLALQTHRA
jgi:pimeloyl-ACP methyl ester carboxylesterase